MMEKSRVLRVELNWSRRLALMGLALAAGIVAGQAQMKGVLLVTSSRTGPYGEATEAFLKASAGRFRVEVLDLEEGGGSRPAEQMEERARRAAVVATFGSRALRAAGKWTARPALVASMVLAADAGEAGEGRGMTVLLDVRLPQVLDELKRLAPRRTRLGLIRLKQPGSVPAQELAGAARERGYTLMVADVAGAEQLLDAFHGMVGKVDLVWCPPDADLFNSATIKPLILASLEHRIPLVGFSPSFLRAGATLGVWPDYGAVGQQTAEACARALEGRTGGKEYPKKVRSGVNERLARLLGADDIQTKDAGDVVIVR